MTTLSNPKSAVFWAGAFLVAGAVMLPLGLKRANKVRLEISSSDVTT